MSRHRGAKRLRQYGLSGDISLLSLAYLLFAERCPFHTAAPGHYDRFFNIFFIFYKKYTFLFIFLIICKNLWQICFFAPS